MKTTTYTGGGWSDLRFRKIILAAERWLDNSSMEKLKERDTKQKAA